MNPDRQIPLIPSHARGWLPPALLILVLATLLALFAFGGDRGYFYRSTVHNANSAKNLSLAENLSPADNFRLFRADIITADGARYYATYSRFPIGGTALIKLVIMPFATLEAKMLAARTLALFMFCGAVVFAYLAVSRLASSRWIGLAAALIAFSSYYALYYSDEISNESAMDIFGVMLTFHGMVIFVQDGRFRQLLIKACAALLIGWHVYAILLAFIVFGLAGEIVARLRGRTACPNSIAIWNIHNYRGGGGFNVSLITSLIRSRYTILGAATLLFGIIVLGSGLVNEYYAHDGNVAPTELQSLRSALSRVSARESRVRVHLNWRVFARLQLFRAGGVSLPYALPWKYGYPEPKSLPLPGVAVGGVAIVGSPAAALARMVSVCKSFFSHLTLRCPRFCAMTRHAAHRVSDAVNDEPRLRNRNPFLREEHVSPLSPRFILTLLSPIAIASVEYSERPSVDAIFGIIRNCPRNGLGKNKAVNPDAA